jgi:hypothetical protein
MLLARSCVLWLLLCWALPPITQAATITFFDSRPNWEAAVGGLFEEEDFDDGLVNAPGLSVSSTVGAVNGTFWDDQVNDVPLQTTEWFFAKPVRGFGAFFDLTPNGPGEGIEFTISLLGGGTQLLAQEVLNSFAGEFFGFTSDVAFTSVLFTQGTQPSGIQETYSLDDLVYSPVPEVSSLLMLGTGILGIALLAGRRRTTA